MWRARSRSSGTSTRTSPSDAPASTSTARDQSGGSALPGRVAHRDARAAAEPQRRRGDALVLVALARVDTASSWPRPPRVARYARGAAGRGARGEGRERASEATTASTDGAPDRGDARAAARSRGLGSAPSCSIRRGELRILMACGGLHDEPAELSRCPHDPLPQDVRRHLPGLPTVGRGAARVRAGTLAAACVPRALGHACSAPTSSTRSTTRTVPDLTLIFGFLLVFRTNLRTTATGTRRRSSRRCTRSGATRCSRSSRSTR